MLKALRYIVAIIFAIVILSFYLPYCSGDGDAMLAKTYGIKGIGDFWKWIVIWLIIIVGGFFIYFTITSDRKD